MNHTKLVENNKSVYQEFYLRHFLVISTPFVMNWSDDVYSGFGGVSIKQKIPLRISLGMEKNTANKIKFGFIQYRDVNNQTFSESLILEYAPYFYAMENLLNDMYEDIIKEYGGITINIISDLPRSKGLGFESAVSMTIAFLMNRLRGKLDNDKIEKISKLEINDTLSNAHIGLSAILGESFSIDLKIFGKTFYAKKVSTLFDGGYPIIAFSENHYKFDSGTVDLDFKRFAFRLNELLPQLRDRPFMPLDYGLIYTGKPIFVEQFIDRDLTNGTGFESIKTGLKPIFEKYLEHLLPVNKPKFYANILNESLDKINGIYGNMMGMVSLEILYFLQKLFSEGYNENDMKNIIKSLEKIRFGNYISRDNSESLQLLTNKMLGLFNHSRNLIALYPNDTSIMGGSLCFMMPTEGFREKLIDTIEKLENDTMGIDLFYANWADGIEYEGLKIEQDIDAGIFSNLLGHEVCIATDINGKRMIGSYEQLLKKIPTGIIFDAIKGKIYCDGVKLTSANIHSQSATIEIMNILMHNLNIDVNNNNLPVSRYSKNKNDMLGKIVIPLVDFIKSKTNKDLDLTCKGSLHDFNMKIKSSNIEVYFLKKI